MKIERTYHERHLTEVQWFWFLAVMGLVTRISLLKVFTADSTDAILNLIYYSDSYVNPKQFYILPGYPFLLKMGTSLGLDGIFWGRIIAALSGVLFLIPLWKFLKKWISVEACGITCLLALFSPLLWEWSLKAMSDTLFLMAFWWALERLQAVWVDKNEKAWWQACLWGALASLIRPEGFLLFPWIVYANERLGSNRSLVSRLWIIVCWAYSFYLLAPRIELLTLAYREGLGLATGPNRLDEPFVNFVEHLYVYLTQPIFVFTPILFLIAILGLYRILRDKGLGGDFARKVLIPIYLLLLISRLIPTTYQDRHLLPFLPLLLIGAGVEFEGFFAEWGGHPQSVMKMLWKNGLLSLCLIYMVVFSTAVIVGGSDSFGDIKRTSEFLKTLPADAVIYSDEIPKTQYWAGRKVRLLDYSQTPFIPNRGDFVVLHSFYTPRINSVGELMTSRFGAALIHSDSSSVTPLFTDLMQNFSLQNRISATAYRFEPQFFASVVYQIKPPVGK